MLYTQEILKSELCLQSGNIPSRKHCDELLKKYKDTDHFTGRCKRELNTTHSSYIWLDPALLGNIGNVPSRDVLPSIKLPLSDSANPMVCLFSLMKVALRHNIISAILTLAGGRKVIQVYTSIFQNQSL